MNKEKCPHIILPTSYCAPISHYALKIQFPTITEIQEHFQKRSWRNKMAILAPNGIQNLSIPLEKGKTQTLITDVQIAYHEDWIKAHTNAIRTAYSSAPYFEYYINELVEILQSRFEKLFDLNEILESWLSKKLDIHYDKLHTSSFEKNYSAEFYDFRRKPINCQLPYYHQVFEDKFGFTQGLSILDLLFNCGPESIIHLKNALITFE